MVQIVSEPYLKTYSFSSGSFTYFTRIVLLIITIAAPFFIVYKTGNFYQTTKTNYINLSNVNLKPTYQYYISLKTSQQSYIFTNLFINQGYQGLNIKFTQQSIDSLQVQIQYPKSLAEKVKSIDVYVPFQYANYNKTSYGIAKANVQGYDLAEVVTTGFIQFKDGTGTSPVLKSDNILKQNNYNFLSVYEQFYKSSSYLTYRYNSLPISLPTDIFKANIIINYPYVKVQEKTPSILGQLIWSWIQYFPIFFVFYLVNDYIWSFLLKEGIVKSTLKHDKQYLQIVRKQQDQRRRNFSHRIN